MNVIRGIMVRLQRPFPSEPESHGAQINFLRAARRELQTFYPRVRPWAIPWLLRRHGLRRIPDGLFLEARPSGTFWKLVRVSLGKYGGIDWHPLFSSSFYMASNPDLAGLRASPWLHYQVFGRAEGRTPHPLIDTARLAASMPGVRKGELVDEYFADPSRWLIDPSVYVDAQNFVMNGAWDGATHPLKEIVTRHLAGPWIHSRLMVVDSSNGDESLSRVVAAGALLLLAGGSARVAVMKSWSYTLSEHPTSAGGYTVVPGYFIGSGSSEIHSDSGRALSPDSSMIRHATGFVSILRGPEVKADVLIYLTSELPREALEVLLRRKDGSIVLSPHSAAQEVALKLLREELSVKGVTVLKYGAQAHVTSAKQAEIFLPVEFPPPVSEWDKGEELGRDIAVVISSEHWRRAGSDARVRGLIEAGAALCLVDGQDVEPWLPILSSRSRILVERSLLGLIGGIVNREAIFALNGGEVGDQP